MAPRLLGLLGVVFLVLSGLSGCGGSDWGHVDGVVTLQGEAVGPGVIIFEPMSGGQTQSAMGHFAEDGRYELKSTGNESGTAPGEYRVRIYPGGENFTDESSAPPQASKIPPRYREFEAGLTATVQPGENTINFDLEP